MELLNEENFVVEMYDKVLPFLNGVRNTEMVEGIYTEHYIREDAKADLFIMHGYSEALYKYYELIYYMYNEGFNVHAIEARGHGRSVKTTKGRNNKVHILDFNQYIEDLKRLIDGVEKKRPKYLLGHSMGGCITLRLLEIYPDIDIDKVVLSSPMMRLNTKGIPEKTSLVIAKHMCNKGKEEHFVFGQRAWLEINDTFEKAATSSLGRYEYFKKMRLYTPAFQKAGASYAWMREALFNEILARHESDRITKPLLVIQGENDTYVDTSYFKKLKCRDVEIVPTHNTKHEVLNSTNDVLLPILERILEYLN